MSPIINLRIPSLNEALVELPLQAQSQTEEALQGLEA